MLAVALLLAQLGAETTAAAVGVPPLVISSVSPAAFPTASATVVSLEGSGFVLGVPAGWHLRCRLTSACPTNGHECTTFTHAGYSGGAMYANATVLNDTHATCVAGTVADDWPEGRPPCTVRERSCGRSCAVGGECRGECGGDGDRR